MDSEGPLLTIAEISVALAGFASIVVAIRGANPSGWSRQDRFGLANVFAASLAALVGSLVPFPLHQLALSDTTVWSISNALFVVMPVAYLTFLVVRQRGSPPRLPWLFWGLAGTGCGLVLALTLASLGLVVPPGPGLLLVALIYSLLTGFAQLGTFLLLSALAAEPDRCAASQQAVAADVATLCRYRSWWNPRLRPAPCKVVPRRRTPIRWASCC